MSHRNLTASQPTISITHLSEKLSHLIGTSLVKLIQRDHYWTPKLFLASAAIKTSDHLVQASTSTKLESENSNRIIDDRPCKRLSSCSYCPQLNTSGTFTCKTTNQTLKSKVNINCQTTSCIYLITCSSCGIQYVGQTKNKLLTRFNSHNYDISHNSDTTVARHFNRCPRLNSAKFEGLNISVLSFIRTPSDTKAGQAERDKEEKCWIHCLSSVFRQGLNLLD